MRLLQIQDDGAIILTQHSAGNIPPYAILSHTWGPDDEEVTFDDMVKGVGTRKRGYDKIEVCRKRAVLDNLGHFWVDSCCIDKSSSSELSHAINSMFRWYQNSAKCYVCLTDVTISCHEVDESPPGWELSFRRSRWFTRGWTLQELLAPSSVDFLSAEGQLLGTKGSLERLVHEITGIPVEALRGRPLSDFGRRERMSWARARSTKVEEDAAYCLLGIFGVNLSLIYGEGVKYAFVRLEEEISRRAVFERRSEGRAPSTNMLQCSAEEEQCLQSLWFPTMDARRRNLQSPARQTCGWLFRHKGYLDWIYDRNREKHQGLLWLTGNPGVGKSTLMKEAFRQAVEMQGSSDTCLAAFFFDAKGCELDRSPVGLFRSLLHQLLPMHRGHLRNFVQLCKEKSPVRDGRTATVQPWDEKELETFVQTMLSHNTTKRTIIFIDALDECGPEGARSQAYFWRRLTRFPGGKWSNISVCLSCRHSVPVSLPDDTTQIVLENHNSQDIVTYVNQSFHLGNLVADPRSGDLKDRLLVKSRGIFLWAALVVDQILKGWDYGKNMQSLIDELDRLPPGIEALYFQMLAAVDPKDKELTLRFFQWAVLASQPLRLYEWHHVLALVRYPQLQSLKQWRTSEFFTETDDQLVKQIRILSKGLVNVTSGTAEIRCEGLETESACASAGSMNLDSGESRICTIIHQSVRDFFLTGGGFALLDPLYHEKPIARGHLSIMDACLYYVNVGELDALVQARNRIQHREEHHREVGEALESTQNQKARDGQQTDKGPSESSVLTTSLAITLDDRSHDDQRHAKQEKLSNSPLLVSRRVQDDPGFNALADLADSDKYMDVARWLELLPSDRSVAHDTALEDSASRFPVDRSVSGLSRQLVDYPALLSYATFELFHHARLAEAEGADPANIILRLQDGHTWSRWVALHEDVPQLMKLEDYASGQGLTSWVRCILGGSTPSDLPQPNSNARQRIEHVVSKSADGLYLCTFNGCKEEIQSFRRLCEWRKHMDKHERPYRCHETGCESLPGFTYSGGLLRHERVVHGKYEGSNIFTCPYPGCKRNTGKGFSRQENLQEHIRRVHSYNERKRARSVASFSSASSYR